MQQNTALSSSSRVVGPVFVIAAASAALAYFMSSYSSQPRTVSITPPAATPAAVEQAKPSLFTAPPQATPPAPAAATDVQAAPLTASQPATATGAQKKRKPRRHKK